MRILNVVGLIVLAILTGCSDQKIDVTSDETIKTSIQKVRKSLPEVKQKKFDEALQVLAFSQVDMKTIFSGSSTVAIGHIEESLKESLKEKTGEQIIDEAARIQEKRKEKERQEALSEIKELETKKKNSAHTRNELNKFKVTRSRFYLQKQEYGLPEPTIEISVKNETHKAVATAYFDGIISSRDRSVPWFKGSFRYDIPGGLEPGEGAEWFLVLNMFSDWGKVDAPQDAVFTVTVTRLDGPSGKSLYSTMEFNEDDFNRINQLKKTYNVE